MKYAPLFPLLLAAIAAAQSLPAPPAPPKRETIDLKTTPAADILTWTPASTGPGGGEFLLSPQLPPGNPYGHPPLSAVLPRQIQSGDDSYCGTRLGLLRRTKDGPWQLVPEYFGRSVHPVAVEGNLLWLDEFTADGPKPKAMGLVAMDLKTLKTVSTVPEAKGRLIALLKDGFLCATQEGIYPESSALIIYDRQGKQVLRQEFKGQFIAGVWSLPSRTWIFTMESIFMNRNPFTSLLSVETGTGKIAYGLDGTQEPKEAGGFIGVEYQWHFDQGAFIEVAAKRQPDDTQIAHLIEFDADTLKRRAGPDFIIAKNDDASIFFSGDVIWIYGHNDHRPFSRKTLRPLDPKDVEDPFKNPKLPANVASIDLVAATDHTAWFISPSDGIFAQPDAAAPFGYAAPGPLKPLLTPNATLAYPSFVPLGQRLAVVKNNALAILDPEKQNVRLYTDANPPVRATKGFYSLTAASPTVLWLSSRWGGPFDLQNDTFIRLDPPVGHERSQIVASTIRGKQMLYLGDYDPWIFQFDLANRKGKALANWADHIGITNRSDPKQDQLARSWRDSIQQRLYITPDNTLVIIALAKGENPDRKLATYLLDITKGSFSNGDEAWTAITPIDRGDQLYGVDATRLRQWKNHAWTKLASLPAPLRYLNTINLGRYPPDFAPAGPNGPRAAVATEKYLYAPTPLGPYRITWDDLLKPSTSRPKSP